MTARARTGPIAYKLPQPVGGNGAVAVKAAQEQVASFGNEQTLPPLCGISSLTKPCRRVR